MNPSELTQPNTPFIPHLQFRAATAVVTTGGLDVALSPQRVGAPGIGLDPTIAFGYAKSMPRPRHCYPDPDGAVCADGPRPIRVDKAPRAQRALHPIAGSI